MTHYEVRKEIHIVRPGKKPSSQRLQPGEVFEVDGEPDDSGVTDGLRIDRMIQRGAIKKIRAPTPKAPGTKGKQ